MSRGCRSCLLWLRAGVLAGGALLFACSGSASETPWPVEPPNREPPPAGEELTGGPEIDVDKIPDRYSPRDAGTDAQPGD